MRTFNAPFRIAGEQNGTVYVGVDDVLDLLADNSSCERYPRTARSAAAGTPVARCSPTKREQPSRHRGSTAGLGFLEHAPSTGLSRENKKPHAMLVIAPVRGVLFAAYFVSESDRRTVISVPTIVRTRERVAQFRR